MPFNDDGIVVNYDLMYNYASFIQDCPGHFTHVCCSCGSSHNIKLEVVNGEEVAVQYHTNYPMTRKMRRQPSDLHGVLVTHDWNGEVVKLIEAVKAGNFKSAKRIATFIDTLDKLEGPHD